MEARSATNVLQHRAQELPPNAARSEASQIRPSIRPSTMPLSIQSLPGTRPTVLTCQSLHNCSHPVSLKLTGQASKQASNTQVIVMTARNTSRSTYVEMDKRRDDISPQPGLHNSLHCHLPRITLEDKSQMATIRMAH